jgi:hypothetical protein
MEDRQEVTDESKKRVRKPAAAQKIDRPNGLTFFHELPRINCPE